MNRTNQSTIIKEAINSYLDKGVTDKQDIYTKAPLITGCCGNRPNGAYDACTVKYNVQLPHNEKQELNISAKFLSLLLNLAPRDGLEPTT